MEYMILFSHCVPLVLLIVFIVGCSYYSVGSDVAVNRKKIDITGYMLNKGIYVVGIWDNGLITYLRFKTPSGRKLFISWLSSELSEELLDKMALEIKDVE